MAQLRPPFTRPTNYPDTGRPVNIKIKMTLQCMTTSFYGSASTRGLDDVRANGCEIGVLAIKALLELSRPQPVREFGILCSALRANPDLGQIADALKRDVNSAAMVGFTGVANAPAKSSLA